MPRGGRRWRLRPAPATRIQSGPCRDCQPLARCPRSEVHLTGDRVDALLRSRGCLRRGPVDTDAHLGEDQVLDLVRHLGVGLEEGAGILLALAELNGVVGEPGTGLADASVLDTEVDEAALSGDALPVQDVELGLLERRRHLVRRHLDAGALSNANTTA